MLRTRVRLGRSLTCSDQTREYAVTLDGEVPFPPEDCEGVLEKVAELFYLADEALAREIERGDDQQPTRPQHEQPLPPARSNSGRRARPPAPMRSGSVTPKQLQFLQTLARRKHLSHDDLDAVIARIVGSARKIGDLTKKEAGQVIDHLSTFSAEAPE